MGRDYVEFAPLETERAKELQTIINRAAHSKGAVVINPEDGVADSTELELISPLEKTNALTRYQRHYGPATGSA